MKKINNKGFLLIETLAVATFTLTVLVLLFVYFKDLINVYTNNSNYNTVEGIYNANAVKRYLIQNGDLKTLYNQMNNSVKYLEIYNASRTPKIKYINSFTNQNSLEIIANAADINIIIYTKSDLTELKNNNNLSKGMDDFITSLKSEKNRHRIIIEYQNGTYATIVFGYGNS